MEAESKCFCHFCASCPTMCQVHGGTHAIVIHLEGHYRFKNINVILIVISSHVLSIGATSVNSMIIVDSYIKTTLSSLSKKMKNLHTYYY